jgi:hypothetical protein
VKVPVRDWTYHRTIQDNAVDGLLISSSLEPGFSGGPTCNAAGEVVGINVTKDTEHVSQNGAVNVSALKQLMKEIKPAKERRAPRPDEVAELVTRLQSEYLLLPIERRFERREYDVVSALDLPRLRLLVDEVRALERVTTIAPTSDGMGLSPQASLGMMVATLPGTPLETFRAAVTQRALAECEKNVDRIIRLQQQGVVDRAAAASSAQIECNEFAVRPLAWDLVAAALRWDGRERQMSVTRIDQVDRDQAIYRVSLKMSGVANLQEIWVAQDAGRLRLKLFDDRGEWYALRSNATLDKKALAGTWYARRSRALLPKDGAELATEEWLTISFAGDERADVQHLRRAYSRSAVPLACSGRSDAETVVEQAFSGAVVNGAIVGRPRMKLKTTGRDSGCPIYYSPDIATVFKLVRDHLYMYRTEGARYPEVIEFERQD